jgi:hypothetical protein
MQTLERYYGHNITNQISDDKNKLWEYVAKIGASRKARRLVTWSLKEEDCWKTECSKDILLLSAHNEHSSYSCHFVDPVSLCITIT